MHGEMCWLYTATSREKKVLHLRLAPGSPWMHYATCDGLAVPDYVVPGGSRGWATYQKLLRAGWTLLADDAEERRSA